MTKNDVLKKLADGEIDVDAASALLEKLSPAAQVRIKVTPGGCIGIRGLRGTNSQFGLSIRVETWEDLKKESAKIDKFVKEHAKELAEKSAESKAAKAAA